MIRTYFNSKAVIWDETIAEKDTAKLQRMADRLNIVQGSCVLDVGTGTGVFVPLLLSKIDKGGLLVAMDVAEEMLKMSRAKCFRGNIEYLHADISCIPAGKEVFDAIVCYSSFPHFQDKQGAFAEIFRVLKEGGSLFICHTSSKAAINDIHRSIPGLENDVILEEDQMRKMLLAAGYIVITIDDLADSYMVRAIKRELIK